MRFGSSLSFPCTAAPLRRACCLPRRSSARTHPCVDGGRGGGCEATRGSVVVKALSSDDAGVEREGTHVEHALFDAEKAVAAARDAVEHVPSLPSAYPPHPIVTAMKTATKTLLFGGMVFTMVNLLNLGATWLRYVSAAVFPLAISLYSFRKNSLSASGAVAACLVGFGTFLAGFRSVTVLLSFFISSSTLTKFKEGTKEKALADHKKGGQRDWIQVCSNGFFATIFCVVYAFATGFQDLPLGTEGVSKLSTFAFGSVLGNYACTCGDTWASELGVLSTATPRLITSLRRVQKGKTWYADPQLDSGSGMKGTNGGVTWLGLSASLGGGLFVGVMCYVGTLVCSIGQPMIPVVVSQWPVIALGLVGGLLGSIIDSVLGATLQFSGYDTKLKKVVNRPGDNPESVYRINGINLLSNNQVNLLSSLIMAILTGYATVAIYH